MRQIKITKANGEKVAFDVKKLKTSLKRAGASENLIQEIASEISKILYEGMHTKEIYKKAFEILRKASRPVAAKYKLKKAIMQLGPSGFPFERYIAEVLKSQGFDVKVGQIVNGHCVQHEVDVIAEKDNKHFMIECKFHSDSGRKCTVKTPLYIQSRFLDIEKEWKKIPGHNIIFHQGWVATNTQFTTEAIQYGTCAGLYLLGWNHPKEGSLKERIDTAGVHPITCLTTLSRKEKRTLLDQMIVLCKDICKDEKILFEIGLSDIRVKKVMAEAKALCKS